MRNTSGRGQPATVDGRAVRWHEDVYAILSEHGMADGDIKALRKALARNNANALEALEASFSGPSAVFKDAVSALLTATLNRAAL